eukprot:337059-Rhodomonas_salina.2
MERAEAAWQTRGALVHVDEPVLAEVARHHRPDQQAHKHPLHRRHPVSPPRTHASDHCAIWTTTPGLKVCSRQHACSPVPQPAPPALGVPRYHLKPFHHSLQLRNRLLDRRLRET